MLVNCQMAQDQVSDAICAQEQGAPGCVGCKAATRRCLSCHETGVVDGHKGLCATCLRIAADSSQGGSSSNGNNTAKRLEKAVLGIRAFATKLMPMSGHSNSAEATQSNPQMKLPSADVAFAVLTEHLVRRPDGTQLVLNPLKILSLRLHLSANDATRVLTDLALAGSIAGSSPWNSLNIIPDAKAAYEKEERRLDDGDDADDEHAESATPEIAIPKISHRGVTGTERRPWHSTSRESTGPFRRDVDPETAYDVLWKRSSAISGERIVRGPVPVIMNDGRVWQGAAERVLEALVASGHISQRDGWRSVALHKELAETVTVETPVIQQPSLSVGASAITSIPVAHTSPNTNPLSETIKRLEAALPVFRQLRDQVNQKVGTLEAVLIALRAACDEWQQGGAITGRILQEADRVVADLATVIKRAQS